MQLLYVYFQKFFSLFLCYGYTDSQKIKAYTQYLIERLFHKHGDFTNASLHYFRAMTFDSKLMLAQYGAGQMYIARKGI